MNLDQISGIVRHIMGFVGAYFVSRGNMGAEQVELWTGLALAVLALVWSYVAKRPVELKPAGE